MAFSVFFARVNCFLFFGVWMVKYVIPKRSFKNDQSPQILFFFENCGEVFKNVFRPKYWNFPREFTFANANK